MNLYHVTYTTNNNNYGEAFVVASTVANAVAAAQTNDATFNTLEVCDQQLTGLVVGS